MSDQRAPSGDIVGTVLNYKYQVIKRLSQGGMGVVYKAQHLMLDAPVALKILLKPESGDAQQRFLSEARLASKIRHPNTVYIADFGVLEDGRAFLEMEYIDGRTLGEELTKGPIEVVRACSIAMQIARGLQAVHDKGVVHRDMKPDNVFLLEQDGSKDFVKIVDFGIAKAANLQSGPQLKTTRAEAELQRDMPEANLTQIGMVVGTPGYMAPEQIQGHRVTFRADQYALGCILYQMIAGQPVFDSDTQNGLLMRHLAAPPPSLLKRSPAVKVSKRLDALVQQLLAKETPARFGSMREVEQALQAEIDLLTGSKRLSGTTAMLRQRPVYWFGVAVPRWVLVAVPTLLVLLAVGYGGLRWRARPKPDASLSQQSHELQALRQRAIAMLQKDVKAPAGELRYSALNALGQTGDSELRGDLQEALASPDAATQVQAAAALGSLGDRQAVPVLATLLGSKPAGGAAESPRPLSLQVVVADALRQLGDVRGTRFLDQTLESKDQEAQLRAALLFCAQGPPDVQRVLGAYLQRSGLPAETVLGILTCVARSGDSHAVERLRTQLGEVGPVAVQLAAAVKLAQLGEGDGFAYLRDVLRKRGRDQLIAARELALLSEPDGLALLRQVANNSGVEGAVRQLACDGLGAVGEPADALALAGLMASANEPPLAQAAARAVVRIVGRDPGFLSQQSLSWARSALGDSDALVRRSAATILGDNQNAGAVSLLTGMLKDTDSGVRRSVVTALGRRVDPGAVAGLRNALRDSDSAVRLDALRALLRSGDALKSPVLVGVDGPLRQELAALLADTSTQVTQAERLLAASTLLRLGDSTQLARLRTGLTAPEPELRRLALEQLSLPVSELLALLADKASEVRYLAARKLAELGDRRAVPVLREMVTRGGAVGAAAYALLTRLGAAADEPDPVPKLLTDGVAARRVEAVESLRSRPVAQALPLLTKAARDRDMLVRWTVAEVAAELAERPDGDKVLAVLRRLSTDSDPMVRMRAAADLARLQRSAAAETTAPRARPAQSQLLLKNPRLPPAQAAPRWRHGRPFAPSSRDSAHRHYRANCSAD